MHKESFDKIMWMRGTFKPSEALPLITLAAIADKQGKVRESNAILAEKAGVSEICLGRALTSLDKQGLLARSFEEEYDDAGNLTKERVITLTIPTVPAPLRRGRAPAQKEFVRWVLDKKPADLTNAELLGLWSLAYHASPEGSCFPSKACIAAETFLNVRTVGKAIAKLEARGLITRTPRRGKKKNRSNLYQLHLPGVTTVEAVERKREKAEAAQAPIEPAQAEPAQSVPAMTALETLLYYKNKPHTPMMLADFWRDTMRVHFPNLLIKPLSMKQIGQLKSLHAACKVVHGPYEGVDFHDLVDRAMARWSYLATEANLWQGYHKHPAYPEPGYLLWNLQAALVVMDKPIAPGGAARINLTCVRR